MDLYVYKNQKKLKCGYTTGTCATAAAAAAVYLLLLNKKYDHILVKTPKGIDLSIQVNKLYKESDYVISSVIKDSGDDPDVTDGIEIVVKTWTSEYNDKKVILSGGKGVGVVTRNGLEQEVGQPAINKVPRNMIIQAVEEVISQSDFEGSINIEISVPDGEEIAKKTFNPKLGIEGGISILGTSGIVEPMSEKALIDTIETELKILKSDGIKHIIMTPGNYGEKYLRDKIHIKTDKVLKCSNYIGETIDLAVSLEFDSILLVGNFGKLVKLAAGIMNTHSKVADGRFETIGVYSALCGAKPDVINKILNCITTESALDILLENSILEKVIDLIMDKIHDKVNERAYGNIKIGVIVFSETKGYLGKTKFVDEILSVIKGD